MPKVVVLVKNAETVCSAASILGPVAEQSDELTAVKLHPTEKRTGLEFMGGTRISELRGSEGARRGHRGQNKIVIMGLSTEETQQRVLWSLTTGNKKKFNIDYAVF